MKNRLLSRLPVIICLLMTSFYSFSQGDKYFKEKQYSLAIAAYTQEVTTSPEKYMNLAKSYFGTKDFASALTAMENYKTKFAKADAAYADWFIGILKRNDRETPMQLVKGSINTSITESVPRISSDGNRLYFKSADRTGGLGGEDIWYSDKLPDGTWGAPVLFRELSTASHETLYSVSADGNVAILFGNYPGAFGGGDLFYSVKSGETWSTPCNIGGAINSDKWEAQAAISPDGKTIVFVTQNKALTVVGGYDLYFSHLGNKGWSTPENLGEIINTKGSEYRPSFGADGKTLYFSSDGHKGFGGTDIFMAKRLDDSWQKWTEPVNLGRYINTLQDDEDISVNSTGTIGYTVKYAEVGAPGDYDIFQFIMPEIARPEQTIKVYGFVTNEKDSAAAVNIRITNMKTNTLQTIVPSMSSDGSYTVNLPFEKYLFEIDMKGFLYYSEEVDLSDASKFLPHINIRERIGLESQQKLDALSAQLDVYGKQLQDLNKSESYDVKNTFDSYEDLIAKYNITLAEIQKLIAERKYEWLVEETKYVDVLKNFKVQRATEGATFKLDNIFFDLGKATFKSESLPSLDNLYAILVKNKISIELGGHTDSIGTNESNQFLSQERVNSVKKYLVNKGISEDRIVAVGYGEEQPLTSNASESGRAMNRRVEVKIIEKVKPREGTENELVEKKEIEEKEVVAVKEVYEDFDLLARLQNAAMAGGLPAGSPCDTNNRNNATKANYKPNLTYDPVDPSKRNRFSTNQFEKEDYIYKVFSAGIENFGTADKSPFWGFNVRFTKLKDLEEKGRAREHNFTYFPKTDIYEFAAGYQHIRFVSMKTWIHLPVGLIWGLEGKMFKTTEKLTGASDVYAYVGIPVGLRGLINIKQFVVSPDVYYHFAPLRTTAESTDKLSSNYLGFGANVRWKFLYGGVSLNIGENIDYFGLKAGVTF